MELLKTLNNCFSVSGYEDEIRAEVCKELSKHYSVSVDVLGNVIATRAGKGENLAFAAPMDSGGVFLNCEKSAGQYHFVPLSPLVKMPTAHALGRTYDGHHGVFSVSQDKENSYFDLGTECAKLPTVADIKVPFCRIGEYVLSRHGALYTLLRLAEKLSGSDRNLTFVALAQTMLRHRGAYGLLPQEPEIYTLIETAENDRLLPGDGAALCLKEGSYLMPEEVGTRFYMFKKRVVFEADSSLAATVAKQKNGRMVASLKIPVLEKGTSTERFLIRDVNELCEKLVTLG